jgi:NDP-4-keto-2,6-dideoxyhexose 3-C-methyltransferase
MSSSIALETCLVCNGTDLELILDLGSQPLSSVFPQAKEADPESSPLKLMRCGSKNLDSETQDCGHVQLSHQASFDEMYGLNYGYNSSLSPMMIKHLEFIFDRIQNHIEIDEKSIIIDIGCNDGSFLKMFESRTQNLFGADPSSVRFLNVIPKSAQVVPEFFPTPALDELLKGKKAQVISSIAMFYDLLDPKAFIKAVLDRLDDDGIWVVELAELNEFLKNLSYDQICHEHLLYIDNEHMVNMAQSAGFTLIDITYSEMNGGSACYYFMRKKLKGKNLPMVKVSRHQLLQMARRVHQNKLEVLNFFSEMKAKGSKVIGYGASTKGNILGNYYKLDSSQMEAISDINSFKWGRVTPGTRIPIISHEEMRISKPDYLFCFIWHLRYEVLKDEREFIEQGGKIVFPLPRLHVVDKSNYDLYAKNHLNDLAFDTSSRELTL